MGIQFKQIDGLSSTFSSLSGDLQSQITSNTNATSGFLSGSSVIGGWKYFTGNADFSGAQGILVDPNSIYTPNNVFAGGVKVGYPISTPRNSTSGPKGALQVSGGQSYFEGQVNIDNNAGIQISNGDITAGTGNLHFITGETLAYGAGNFTGSLTLRGNPVYTGSGGPAGSSCSGFSGFLDSAGSSYQAISCEDTFTFSGCSGIAASIAGNTLSICYTGTGGGGGGGTTYTAGSGLTLVGTEFNTAGIGVFTQVSGESGVFTDTLTIGGVPVSTGITSSNAAVPISNATGASIWAHTVKKTTAVLAGTLATDHGTISGAIMMWGQTDEGADYEDWDSHATVSMSPNFLAQGGGAEQRSVTSRKVTSLRSGTVYYARVRYLASGIGYYSDAATFTTSTTGPKDIPFYSSDAYSVSPLAPVQVYGGDYYGSGEDYFHFSTRSPVSHIRSQSKSARFGFHANLDSVQAKLDVKGDLLNDDCPVALFNSGNVGIGNYDPQAQLDVTGKLLATSGAFTESLTISGVSVATGVGGGGGTIDGAGTTNYVPKWSDSDTLTDSMFWDNGTNAEIGFASADEVPAENQYTVNISGVTAGILLIKNWPDDKILITATPNNSAFRVWNDGVETIRLDGRGGLDPEPSYINAGHVGIGTDTPSAPLEIASTGGGVIMPRLNTTQMNAISTPTSGEMIYNTTANKFYGYNGAWVALH